MFTRSNKYSKSKVQALSAKHFGVEMLGFKLIRYYLTGNHQGEDLEKIINVLPKEAISERLKFAIEDFELKMKE
jgi:hypothetical protein